MADPRTDGHKKLVDRRASRLRHAGATDRYLLEGAAEHCDEHVDEDDRHDAAVRAVHELADELREAVLLFQFEVCDVDEPVDGEVQRLDDLEEAAKRTCQ